MREYAVYFFFLQYFIQICIYFLYGNDMCGILINISSTQRHQNAKHPSQECVITENKSKFICRIDLGLQKHTETEWRWAEKEVEKM